MTRSCRRAQARSVHSRPLRPPPCPPEEGVHGQARRQQGEAELTCPKAWMRPRWRSRPGRPMFHDVKERGADCRPGRLAVRRRWRAPRQPGDGRGVALPEGGGDKGGTGASPTQGSDRPVESLTRRSIRQSAVGLRQSQKQRRLTAVCRVQSEPSWGGITPLASTSGISRSRDARGVCPRPPDASGTDPRPDGRATQRCGVAPHVAVNARLTAVLHCS